MTVMSGWSMFGCGSNKCSVCICGIHNKLADDTSQLSGLFWHSNLTNEQAKSQSV